MKGVRGSIFALGRAAAIAAGGCLATACAGIPQTETPRTGAVSSAAGLFKATPAYPTGRATWYVSHQPPRYEEVGLASWHADPFHRGDQGEIVAITAARTSLAVPSYVEVTNLKTGRALSVRVDDRAPLKGTILDMSEAAARALDFDGQNQALVRVRYMAPVKVILPDGRRYAETRVRRYPGAPEAPVPTEHYAASALSAMDSAVAAVALWRVPAGAGAAPGLVEGGYRVQAAAFANPANAERALVRLADAGAADIEPLERGGVTLYRVVLRGAGDARAAEAMRLRVAGAGFADARVMRAF